MKLDLLYEIDVPYPWSDKPHPYAQREAEQEAYRNTIEQVKAADRLGFNTVWFVEHHFRENRSHCPSSEAVLGALSQVTENVRLGFGVTLTPHEFIHPARVAEKVATVDVLSQGRVEWGIGRSTPMEQQAFGVDGPTSKAKMLAAAKTVVGMWAADYYEEHSEYLDFPSRMSLRSWNDASSSSSRSSVVPISAAWIAGEKPGLGRSGASSVRGTGFVGHAPYTAAPDTRTTLRTPTFAAASRTLRAPSTLTRAMREGR